jgi:hypothetical protein
MPRWWKWSDTELLFHRNSTGVPEASITALGVGAASAGGHWPIIIKDDLISEDAMNSPALMETSREWFDKSLYLERPAMKGRDLIVCTPWAYDDLYSYVLNKYNYKLYRRAALEDENGQPSVDGASSFPEKLSTGELRAQYERDPYGFSAQMMCHPRPGKEQSFDPDWLRWGSIVLNDEGDECFEIERDSYDPSIHLLNVEDRPPRRIPLRSMMICLLVDPAPSEQSDRNRERNSRNALLIEGIDPYGRRFLLDCWADRVDPLVVIHKMFELCDRWGTRSIGVEEVVFAKLYRHWIRRESELRGKYYQVRPLKPDRRTKDTRITAKIAPCKQGLYYVSRVGCDPFVTEYIEYPYGRTRDLLDAWAYGDEMLHRPESPLEHYNRRRSSYDQRFTANPVTGY